MTEADPDLERRLEIMRGELAPDDPHAVLSRNLSEALVEIYRLQDLSTLLAGRIEHTRDEISRWIDKTLTVVERHACGRGKKNQKCKTCRTEQACVQAFLLILEETKEWQLPGTGSSGQASSP